MSNFTQRAALFTAVAMMLLTSCKSKNTPDPKPEPTTDKVEITRPQTVTVKAANGHFHGKQFHGNPSYNTIAYPLKNLTKLTFELQSDGKSYKQVGEGVVRPISGEVLGIEIDFLNQAGERIRKEYASGAAVDQYQWFISIEELRNCMPGQKEPGEKINKSTAEVLYKFYNRDVEQEAKHSKEQGAKILEKPLGFKGYFTDLDKIDEKLGIVPAYPKYVSFNLRYRLVKFASLSQKLNDGNNRDPFTWHEAFKDNVVVDLVIPVRIIAVHPYDDDQQEQLYKDVAAEFGITPEKAEELYDDAWSLPSEGAGAEQFYL